MHDAVPEYEISWQDTSGKQRFKIPFCYSTNGREYRAAMKTKSGIWYRDVRHTTNMSKALPEWHRPEELLDMLGSDPQKQNQWFAENPGMSELGLRYYGRCRPRGGTGYRKRSATHPAGNGDRYR